MRAVTLKALAGLGAAGLFATAATAMDNEHRFKRLESSPQSSTADDKATAGGGSGARGSGQAGASTGARPGEVTGAPSAPGGTSERERSAAASAKNEVSGKVEKYDRQNRTLTLQDSEKKLKVTDDTQVTRDGARVSPGQLMEGDEVRASYSGSGDVVEVMVIEITSSPAATGSSAAPSSPGPGSGTGAQGGSPKGTGAGSSSETGGGSTEPKEPAR
jgi:hypothetical protein